MVGTRQRLSRKSEAVARREEIVSERTIRKNWD